MPGVGGSRPLATEVAHSAAVVPDRLTRGESALYGWRVWSDVALEPVEDERAPTAPDLVVSAQAVAEVPRSQPGGSVLAEFPRGGGTPKMYWLVEDSQGFLLRMPGLVEYRFSRDIRCARWVRSPGIELEYAREVFRGHAMALLLGLAGYSVFHSSGVVPANAQGAGQARAVALVGGTAAGKSTLAALLVAAGAQFLTDDLLCVDTSGETIAVRGGCSELRLRPSVAGLCRLFDGLPRRQTLDERLAIAVGKGRLAKQPLGLLVFPEISDHVARVTVTNLAAPECAIRLASSPRMSGWLSRDVLERQFTDLVALAAKVPAVRLEVPSTEGLGSELAFTLMREVEAALADSSG